MKTFWKVFAVAFLSFVIIFSGLTWTFNNYMKEDESDDLPVVIIDNGNDNLEYGEIDEFAKLVKNSKRINFIVL